MADSTPLPALPCFTCGKAIHGVTPPTAMCGDQDDPLHATIFRAPGNYGSGVFDPLHGETYLEINLCDGCMKARQDRVYYTRRLRPIPPRPERKLWRGEDE